MMSAGPRHSRFLSAGALGGAALIAALLGLNPTASASENTPTDDQDGYVGSSACEGCHTYIYNRWRSTRHSYSVRTGHEAEAAGFPLPRKRLGGDAVRVRGWQDIAYVIGGRQRIAYIDRQGRALDTSFHHRVRRWDVFPILGMPVCGQCHYTGYGRGPSHPENRALPGRWVERNIGCEACHGPGGRHASTLEKEDIRKDPSSRVCGQCHTAVGKILPKGELHATHDLVQHWNHDRHVTGVRQQSHSAFCARCHSPYDSDSRLSAEDAERTVFTESKLNITCIGCHNPHDQTNAAYSPDRVALHPPLAIKNHTFEGNDGDFTTTDFREWDESEQGCVRCHRGADRVDLDHANATCIDCHNTFNRNHSHETRQFHDTNHTRLSCRGCHDDADHLMTLLFRDPDFLDPKHIHNLRTLPQRVHTRFGFRYPGLTPRATVAALVPAPARDESPGPRAHRALPAANPQARHFTALRDILARAGEVHAPDDQKLDVLRTDVLAAPGSIGRLVTLADAYTSRGHHDAARELLEFAFRVDSSRTLLELQFTGNVQDSSASDPSKTSPEAGAASRTAPEGEPASDPVLEWVGGYRALVRGSLERAVRHFEHALALAPDSPTPGIYLAMAYIKQGRSREARTLLEAQASAHATHHATHAALGVAQLAGRRATHAITALERAISLASQESGALFLLGQAHLSASDLDRAVSAFEAAIALEPGLLPARFAIAAVYRAGNRLDAAARIYQEIVDREPRSYEAHLELGRVLKLISDQLAFQLRHDQERNPPPGISASSWRNRLVQQERDLVRYRNLALSQFAAAGSISPGSLDTPRQVAEIYRRSGRFTDAERVYHWLAQREPENWVHGYRLGTIHLALNRPAQAIRELEKSLELAPTEGDIYMALGNAYVLAGRLDDAIAIFQRGTTYEPFNPGLYTNLGAAHASDGNLPRARSMLERSLELHSFPLPRVHLTETNLALVHLRAGRKDEAVIALRRALHRYADYPLARKLLDAVTSDGPDAEYAWPDYVYNDWLERFGEVTTVSIGRE